MPDQQPVNSTSSAGPSGHPQGPVIHITAGANSTIHLDQTTTDQAGPTTADPAVRSAPIWHRSAVVWTALGVMVAAGGVVVTALAAR
ncbi:hypothetical protein [Kitasatospora sp. NPDC088346]|uniref:hypothetical protein n=1 Tax=Kitasatospora sp. NPDC088346 TaxID=3364073 RepID=UPI0038154294